MPASIFKQINITGYKSTGDKKRIYNEKCNGTVTLAKVTNFVIIEVTVLRLKVADKQTT